MTVKTFKKASLVKLRLEGNIAFQEDVLDLRERLGINDVQMPDLTVPCWTMKLTEGWGEVQHSPFPIPLCFQNGSLKIFVVHSLKNKRLFALVGVA